MLPTPAIQLDGATLMYDPAVALRRAAPVVVAIR